MLNKGKWMDQQLVSPAWIEAMTTRYLDVSYDDPFDSGYGYFWYIGETTVQEKKFQFVYASGNGGNKVFVVPEENLIIAITSSAYGQGYGHGRANTILRMILSALE